GPSQPPLSLNAQGYHGGALGIRENQIRGESLHRDRLWLTAQLSQAYRRRCETKDTGLQVCPRWVRSPGDSVHELLPYSIPLRLKDFAPCVLSQLFGQGDNRQGRPLLSRQQ